MPKSDRKHRLGRQAENAARSLFESEGMIYAESPQGRDYGVDGRLMIVGDSGDVEPVEVAVQVKGVGELKPRGERLVAQSIGRDTLDYLNSFLLPALIVVWEERSGHLYFRWTDALAKDARALRTVRVDLGREDRLNRASVRLIGDRARARHRALRDALSGSGVLVDLTRCYHSLAEVYDVLVDFVMSFALETPTNLERFAARFQESASSAKPPDFAARLASEYRVASPLAMEPLGTFNLLLSTLQLARLELGRSENLIRAKLPAAWEQTNLGIPYARARLHLLLQRATNIDPDEEHRPGVDWVLWDPLHLFMGVFEASFLLRLVLHQLRMVAFPPQATRSRSGSPERTPWALLGPWAMPVDAFHDPNDETSGNTGSRPPMG